MQIRADEVSRILREQIQDYGKQVTVAETGTVLSVGDGIARVYGLDKVQAGVFSMEADKALRAAQAAKGNKLTDIERQKVLDRLVLQGETPGSLWGSNTVRAYQSQAEGRAFTPTWSDDQKRKATAALQRQGIKQPTEQQVDATLRAIASVVGVSR